jgi:hypothetical protein
LAEAQHASVETKGALRLERRCCALVHEPTGATAMNDQKNDGVPPAVPSAPPERELEEELSERPHDLDKKADVGSDQSMDASDPPAAAQPGQNDDPVPSSGFPQ